MQVAGGTMYHHAPSARRALLLGRVEHLPPRRLERVAEADERRASSRSGSRHANIEHGVGDDEAEDVGQDVATHDVALPDPMTRARSTNARSFIDSVCARMIRAVDAQLVMPMTMTMTNSVDPDPDELAVLADDLAG